MPHNTDDVGQIYKRWVLTPSKVLGRIRPQRLPSKLFLAKSQDSLGWRAFSPYNRITFLRFPTTYE